MPVVGYVLIFDCTQYQNPLIPIYLQLRALEGKSVLTNLDT